MNEPKLLSIYTAWSTQKERRQRELDNKGTLTPSQIATLIQQGYQVALTRHLIPYENTHG
jgi:hypothetical protein